MTTQGFDLVRRMYTRDSPRLQRILHLQEVTGHWWYMFL